MEIRAPISTVWDLLTDFDRWSVWGLSMRQVDTDADRVTTGATGRVQTIVGLWVPFEITAVSPEESWFWKVAGISATRHFVSAVGPDHCRARFTVAWALAPYLVAMRVSLVRLKQMAEHS